MSQEDRREATLVAMVVAMVEELRRQNCGTQTFENDPIRLAVFGMVNLRGLAASAYDAALAKGIKG